MQCVLKWKYLFETQYVYVMAYIANYTPNQKMVSNEDAH